jgi:hypothetical protein
MKMKFFVVSVLFVACALTNVFAQNSFFGVVTHADVPRYPPIAITADIAGTVHLHVVVEDGAVFKVEANAPLPHQMLVNAATENVKTWQFGSGIRGSFDVTYEYDLSAARDDNPTRGNAYIELRMPTSVKIIAKRPKPTCNDCDANAFHATPISTDHYRYVAIFISHPPTGLLHSA